MIEPILVLENINKGWHIKRCPLCKVAFVHPQPDPEAIKAHYNGMYSHLATEFDAKKMHWARKSIGGYLSTLNKKGYLNKQTLLDIGGGLGYYSKAFEEAGLSVTLVEQDPISAKFARNILKVTNIIELSSDDFFKSNTRKYDIVFLRHVIEHSTDPLKLLRNVADIIKDKGVFIIETDNNEGVELLCRPITAKFYLSRYHLSYEPVSFLSLIMKRPLGIDPPNHLFGFRISNLSAILEQNDLIPFVKFCYRTGHPLYWPNLPLPPLSQVFCNIINLRKRRAFFDIVEYALYPFRFLLERMGLASGICLYAKKVK